MNHKQLAHNLRTGKQNCIAYADGTVFYQSTGRGIRPLFELCEKNTDRIPLCVADKVIGKAAALLCAKCSVQTLFADVISESALHILDAYSIDVAYRHLVPYITNRDRTGKCPMEQLSRGTENPEEMYTRIRSFLTNSQL